MSPIGGCPHPPHCTSEGLAAARLLGTSPCQPLLAQLLARPADSHGHLLTPTHERWRAAGPSGFPGLPAPLLRRGTGAPSPVLSSQRTTRSPWAPQTPGPHASWGALEAGPPGPRG